LIKNHVEEHKEKTKGNIMTEAQCWESIINGKTLIYKDGTKVKLSKDGRARKDGTGIHFWDFHNFEDWKIYEEPIMYYRWKKKSMNKVLISESWYEGKPVKFKDGWTRIEPGKTFEEIE
jgi:hypothetical protein